MKRVSIIGMGLMGGSLGLALKSRGLAEVHVYARREETRQLALAMGAADAAFETPAGALRGADITVFCLPVCSIPDVARECSPHFEPECVVTDVGSTKVRLVEAMHHIFKGSRAVFVGSHPIAGSEKHGMDAARADLYEGTMTAVTPGPDTPSHAIQVVTWLWSGVGAKVVRLAPDQHDTLIARTSHLPHLVASLLATTVGRELAPSIKSFCGTGFRDSSRVASGSPEIWQDVVKTNHSAILGELKAYGAHLTELIHLVEAEDYQGVHRFLESAKQARSDLLG